MGTNGVAQDFEIYCKRRLGDGQHHGYKVANTCGQYKQMPNQMVVHKLIPQVKYHTQRIQDAANHDEHQDIGRNTHKKSFAHHQKHPTHQEVNDGGKKVELIDEKYFENRACQCQSPQNAKQGDACTVEQKQQDKWGVTARDQEVNADVVENLQDVFDKRLLKAVVQGRTGVHHQKTECIDADAYRSGGVATFGRQCQ